MSVAGTSLHLYPQTFLDKNLLRHHLAVLSHHFSSSRQELLVPSAFLGTSKNTWRPHGISVFSLHAGKMGRFMVTAGLFEPRLALSPEDTMMMCVSLHQKVDGF